MNSSISQPPPEWTHYEGPLHYLLVDGQAGRCAICSVPATFKSNVAGQLQCSLVQWVQDDLLYGLVCATCRHRFKWRQQPPPPHLADALAAFLADPPAQRCDATKGLGSQTRPRLLRFSPGPVEEPTPKWSYYGTVIHSLYLNADRRCHLCRTGLPVRSAPRGVHVDHDPATATGQLRGLLCVRCNTCLGQPLPDTWWGPLADAKNEYLNTPPAQAFPDTAGLTMKDRYRRVAITLSPDRRYLLLGSMPLIDLNPTDTTKEQHS